MGWIRPLAGGRSDRVAAAPRRTGERQVLVVRRDNRRVWTIGGRPVDQTFSVTKLGRVDWRLEQPQHPDLPRRLAVLGVEEDITLEQSYVGGSLVPRLGRQCARVDWTVAAEEQLTA